MRNISKEWEFSSVNRLILITIPFSHIYLNNFPITFSSVPIARKLQIFVGDAKVAHFTFKVKFSCCWVFFFFWHFIQFMCLFCIGQSQNLPLHLKAFTNKMLKVWLLFILIIFMQVPLSWLSGTILLLSVLSPYWLQGAVKRRDSCRRQKRNVCRSWRRWGRKHSSSRMVVGSVSEMPASTKSPSLRERQSRGPIEYTE